MAIEAKKVKELREKTGLPMMECKRALEAAGGEVDKAYEELRKAGLKAQEKLAGREANDGKIGSLVQEGGRLGVLVALRCETEPVSKNEQFLKLLDEVVGAVATENPSDLETLKKTRIASSESVEAGLTDLVNQIRENITVGRFARFEGDAIVQYIHFDGKKAAMVVLEGGSTSDEKVAELGKDLCMHVVFSKPACLSRDRLEPEVVEKEREILLAAAKNDPKNAKKPENIVEKIVQGQLEKFVASQCFLEQPFIKDDKQTVEKYVQSTGLGVKLTDFAYVATDLE